MLDINNYSNFLFKAFNCLNSYAEIKATGLSILNESNLIALTRPFGSVILFRKNLNEYINKYSTYGDNIIKTLLLEVLAHEISHAGQKINYYVISNYSQHNIGYNDYIEFIEKTNIKNSITNLILKNEFELNSALGFIIQHNWLIAKLQCNEINANYISKANYMQECFEQNLCLLFKNDSFKLYKNIVLEDGNYIKFNNQYLMNNLVLLQAMDNMTAKFNTFKIIKSDNTTLVVRLVL